MSNTSVQAVSTLVASLTNFIEVKLVMIETEIRYFDIIKHFINVICNPCSSLQTSCKTTLTTDTGITSDQTTQITTTTQTNLGKQKIYMDIGHIMYFDY